MFPSLSNHHSSTFIRYLLWETDGLIHPLSYKTCSIPFSLPPHPSCSFVFVSVISIPYILAFCLSLSRCHPLLVSEHPFAINSIMISAFVFHQINVSPFVVCHLSPLSGSDRWYGPKSVGPFAELLGVSDSNLFLDFWQVGLGFG